MNAASQRVFEAKPGVREAAGLLIGIVGPSSSGKTYSAMRIAAGIQRVVGGDVYVDDTENRRALYYADRFKFQHVHFGAPFSPLDYLESIRYCAKQGAKTVIVDSMSHEHEGPGGVLEWHEEETQRLAKLWGVKEEKAQLAAWGPPKKARRKLINEMLQLNINLIFTFRAKEKIRIVKGKDPVELGWQPIAGDEFIYEMVLQCLLKPNSGGVPSWTSEFEAERAIMKQPVQFQKFFGREPAQIDEELGERLAEWAAGGTKPAPELDALIADYAKCSSEREFKALEKRRGVVWVKPMPAGYKWRIKEASDAALKRISGDDRATPADAQTWADTLAGQSTLEDLERAWEECSQAFGGMPGNECDSAYQLRKEALTEDK